MKRVLFYLPATFFDVGLADVGPIAERVLVDLRPRHVVLDAIYKAVNAHMAEHRDSVEFVVLDVRSYLSLKYPVDDGRLLTDEQTAYHGARMLCGHMTSDEPTVIIVSDRGADVSLRLLADPTPGSRAGTADSRTKPNT